MLQFEYLVRFILDLRPSFEAFDLEYDQVMNRNQNIMETFQVQDDDMMTMPENVAVVGTEIEEKDVTLVDSKIEDYGF